SPPPPSKPSSSPQHPLAASPGSACPTLVPTTTNSIAEGFAQTPPANRRLYTESESYENGISFAAERSGGLPLRDHGRAPPASTLDAGAATQSDRTPPIRAPARTCTHVLGRCAGAGLCGSRTPSLAVRGE
ncbi:hypothetical protein V495_08296, partial [Pseudogymnoascus sp. VKM F-4514 (FW-929)]